MRLTNRGKVLLTIAGIVAFIALLGWAGKTDLESACDQGSQSACEAVHK
jgi:hypothetical protein